MGGDRGEEAKPQTGGQTQPPKPQLGSRAFLKGEGTSWALAHICLPDGTDPRDTNCSRQQKVGDFLSGT